MKIINIEWLSIDETEAAVEVSDGMFFCISFSHPCNLREGNFLTDPLLGFNVSDLMKVEDASQSIERIGNSLKHKVIGKLTNLDPAIIEVGKIKIELDGNLPGGLHTGELLQFVCGRLDII